MAVVNRYIQINRSRMRHVEASKSIMMLTYKSVYISKMVELSIYIF